jgi:hypothetical protein
MFDVLTAPVSLAVGRNLAMSALPDAPVVAERPRTTRWPVALRLKETR